jgi:hypothetical protein
MIGLEDALDVIGENKYEDACDAFSVHDLPREWDR